MATDRMASILFVVTILALVSAEDYATALPCPKDNHHFVVFDLGNDNPNSNEEALRLIRDDASIATRSFTSSEEQGGTLRLYEGHLAAINDREERDCVSLFLQSNGFAIQGDRTQVRVSGQDVDADGIYLFDCGSCLEQGDILPDQENGPLNTDPNSMWDFFPLFLNETVVLQATQTNLAIGFRSQNLTYLSTQAEVALELVPFVVEYVIVESCTPEACANGAICTKGANGTFLCDCSSGWRGDTCTEDVDDCLPSPCANGECHDLGTDEFNCTCHSGWIGDLCDIDVNDCEGNPCKNGNCTDVGTNLFECACDEGWIGETCEAASSDRAAGMDTPTLIGFVVGAVGLCACAILGFIAWKTLKAKKAGPAN